MTDRLMTPFRLMIACQTITTTAAAAAEQEPERTELASFLCPYFGAVKVKTDGHTEEDGEVIEPTCMHFLVLQDLCNGLDNPCALDVKMGRVTVEPGEREVSSILSCSPSSK